MATSHGHRLLDSANGTSSNSSDSSTMLACDFTQTVRPDVVCQTTGSTPVVWNSTAMADAIRAADAGQATCAPAYNATCFDSLYAQYALYDPVIIRICGVAQVAYAPDDSTPPDKALLLLDAWWSPDISGDFGLCYYDTYVPNAQVVSCTCNGTA